MPQPRLIHPIEIEIQLIDRDDTVYDEYAREPVGNAIRSGESPRTGTSYILKAQVSYYFAGAKQEYASYERYGVDEETTGYIAVRYKDLLAQGLLELDANGNFINMQITRSDRIIRIAREYVDYYISGFKPFGHYPKQKQTLFQANFKDRAATYQQGDL